MKTCFKCGKRRHLSQYYRHAAMADGHLNKCKACTKDDALRYRSENLERVKKYDRIRGRLPHRLKANKERARLPENRARDNERKAAWRWRNADKRAAHIITRSALRGGRLTRCPCEVCGAAKSEAHHDDYGKPLEVRWLCRKHHCEHHRMDP